ncbi:hypothetical protein BCR32DRAFT_265161 [Anaeromyces robustus]|uniref:Uncharacterized protein n=1 Tax=Anaeromyces robustus TaxID=1754192 RepID=A0A1Y1XKB8_9FUNG|nr:hypothetical protein BCR32DRAFT_265161 [Anaeromyces robustus]|eukprot:ORX86207.1 hypothetical protein BCR32DRAFT_265161 [Anaeromyces robustus]
MSMNKINYIKQIYSPLIGIVESKDVEELFKECNFNSVVDFLTPYGHSIKPQGRQFNYQDAQGQTITLNDFSLRFIDFNNLREQNYTNIDKVALRLLKKYKDIKYDFDLLSKIKPNDNSDIEENAPWFKEYKNVVNSVVSVSEHESFDHPLSSFIFVSTNNNNPLSTFEQLQKTIDSHPIFKTEYVDPNIIKHYILIHDKRNTSDKEIENLKMQMKKLFGLQFDILALDFKGGEELDNAKKPKTNFWTETMVTQEYLNMLLPKNFNTGENSPPLLTSPLNNEGLPLFKDVDKNLKYVEKAEMLEYGKLISSSDNLNVNVFLSDFISLTLLPYMERNIHHLNEQVASSRRGINRFFNAGRKYFGNSSKQMQQRNIVATIDGLNRYSYQSAEAQMRKLADLSFMLCDYKFAYSVYDNVKKDFNSNEQDRKYYAGTQGMIVLCLLMYNSVKLNIDTIMEHSVLNYNKCKAYFYAQKTTFSYNFLLKQLNQYKKISQAYLRITNDESNVISGLLLEQTSYCFLKIKPRMIRKYAFHLILAGHRYSRCGHREHAYRCYFTALKIYKDKNWTLIDDHINFMLGRQAFHLADLNTAVEYFLKLLHGSKQSVNQQNAYMKEFLYIYKQYIDHKKPNEIENRDDIITLSIPYVDDKTIKVLLFDVIENQNEEQIVMDNIQQDDEWEILDNLVSMENVNNSFNSNYDNNQNTCTIGEPIYVAITLSNPMKIPLELDKLILDCNLIPSNNGTTQKIDSIYENDKNYLHYDNYYLQQIEHVKLNPNSKERIKIVVIPKIEGTLKIQGIKYFLFDLVKANHPFRRKGKRLNATLEQRMNQVYADDKSLTFSVTPPMPLLDVVFYNKPTTIFAGETTKIILEINNKGNCTLKNLKLVMNQNSLIYVGSPEMINDNIYAITNNSNILENNEVNNNLIQDKVYDILLPVLNDGSRGLESGTTTLIPIWIHFSQIGKIAQRFLFNYYSEINNQSYSRNLKYMINLQVLPSLRINAFTRKSSSKLNEFILGIEVENLLNDASINLQQISINSPLWKMNSIPTELSNEDDYIIEPHQTSLIYYRLVQLTDNEKVPTKNMLPEFYSCQRIENFLLGEKNESQENKIILYSDHFQCKNKDSLILMKNDGLKYFILKSKYNWRIEKLVSHYPYIPKKDLPDLFTLFQTDDVDLLIFWENNHTKNISYQFIPGINLGIQQSPLQYSIKFKDNASKSINMINSKALFSQTAQKKKELLNSLLNNKTIRDTSPLRVNIKSKNIIYHNFSQSKTCVVPVSIFIKNCSYNKLAYYKINMTNKKIQSENYDHDNIEEFIWIGKMSSNGYLKPKEEKVLQFNAAISKYGIYNLNKWSIKVKTQHYIPDMQISDDDIIFDETNIKDTENLYMQSSTNTYNVNVINK